MKFNNFPLVAKQRGGTQGGEFMSHRGAQRMHNLSRSIGRVSQRKLSHLFIVFIKEVVAFIVSNNKGRHVFNPDLPDCFHPKFFEIDNLH